MTLQARGIDISHYQRVTNWPLLAQSWDFVIFKAIEGRHEDPHFAPSVASAKAVGLSWGAYAFFRPDVAVVDQINAYLALLDRCAYGPGNLVPAIDVETEGGLPYGPATHASQVAAFARALIDRYGKAMIYTSQHMWRLIGNPPIMNDPDVLLWVAHYTDAAEPAVPMGKAWSIWQHGARPTAGIVSGPDGVDVNVCAGAPPWLI